jgi:cytoskeletal protein CcmA (bactofilin family)
MFKSKNKSSFDDMPATSTTIIGAGTTITGNVQSNGDIRIDGTIVGNLEAKAKVIIGANGLIQGDVYGKQADVFGKVKGSMNIDDLLCLHGKAAVDGDLYAGNLQIEPTASFNGKCHMGASIVELQKELPNVMFKETLIAN